MGRVTVAAKIESLQDLYNVKSGRATLEQVRNLEVEQALVDTGASTLSMPRTLIDQLGLRPTRSRRVRTAGGMVEVQGFDAVKLTVQDRNCIIDVLEIPEGCPVLIGQIPLQLLDFVVDLTHHQLIGNPDHGGEEMMELYGISDPNYSSD